MRTDLSGQRFGLLVAVRVVGQSACRSFLWLCRCDCGRESTVPTGDLKAGHTRSCGCLRRTSASVRTGASNPQWKGDEIKHIQSGRRRARSIYGRRGCSVAGCERIAERHHKDGNTKNNEASNIEFVCHKHHMGLPETRAAMSAGWRNRKAYANG